MGVIAKQIRMYNGSSKIRLRRRMRICSENNHAKCQPDPIRNDGVLGFFKDGRRSHQQE